MKKALVLIPLLTLNFLLSHGQDSTKSRKMVFTIVEEMPTFPGGEKALMKFIEKNKSSQCHDGADYVTFIVDTDGVAKEQRMLKPIRSLVSMCDTAAALKIVDMMPKWIPGKQNGHKVAVQYHIPIRY